LKRLNAKAQRKGYGHGNAVPVLIQGKIQAMPYLIDGHNLIPKVGLRLDSPNDELELARLLQDFARIKRQPVEVYFDGAPPGQAGTRSLGGIKMHFIRAGQTADSAIRARLNKMGKTAKNWVVVSSDREVQSSAHVVQAEAISSETFAKLLKKTISASPPATTEKGKLTAAEVDEWLEIFQGKSTK
jgi:predicted RNA-binding protein with PIN domain